MQNSFTPPLGLKSRMDDASWILVVSHNHILKTLPKDLSKAVQRGESKGESDECPNLLCGRRNESVERLPACLRFEVEVAAAAGGDRMPLSQMQETALFCATLTSHILSHPSSVKQSNG